MATTWMCDNGHHGTQERRYMQRDPLDGRATFRGMYSGQGCAGTVMTTEDVHNPGEIGCSCECHKD